jgi:hypothetical protein
MIGPGLRLALERFGEVVETWSFTVKGWDVLGGNTYVFELSYMILWGNNLRPLAVHHMTEILMPDLTVGRWRSAMFCALAPFGYVRY